MLDRELKMFIFHKGEVKVFVTPLPVHQLFLQLLLANCPNSAISNHCFSRFVDVVMEVEAEGL